MRYRFIELTFHRPEHKYGGTAGSTNKKFDLRADRIEMMVEYETSTKLILTSGEHVEVSESRAEIKRRISA